VYRPFRRAGRRTPCGLAPVVIEGFMDSRSLSHPSRCNTSAALGGFLFAARGDIVPVALDLTFLSRSCLSGCSRNEGADFCPLSCLARPSMEKSGARSIKQLLLFRRLSASRFLWLTEKTTAVGMCVRN
jgi:hypothetical protein